MVFGEDVSADIGVEAAVVEHTVNSVGRESSVDGNGSETSVGGGVDPG